ncbi:unnamed protein product [Gordionus sp. m RMFG-2023]
MNKNARKTKNKDQRGEYRRLKRENTRTDNLQCFKCRQFGHILKNCLSLSNDDGENLKFVEEENFDICYKCGSLEHKSLHCISFTSGGAEEYPFAKCFVCGKMGHIAKSCSSNDKEIKERWKNGFVNWKGIKWNMFYIWEI